MVDQPRNPVNFSLKSIAVGLVCIIVAQLILVGLQQAFALPFSETIQRSIATAVGVLAWFYVGGKMGT